MSGLICEAGILTFDGSSVCKGYSVFLISAGDVKRMRIEMSGVLWP